jgi:hypothetical protein
MMHNLPAPPSRPPMTMRSRKRRRYDSRAFFLTIGLLSVLVLVSYRTQWLEQPVVERASGFLGKRALLPQHATAPEQGQEVWSHPS